MDKFFVKHDINYYITDFKMDVWKKDKKQKQTKNVRIDTFVAAHFSQFKCKIKFKFKI